MSVMDEAWKKIGSSIAPVLIALVVYFGSLGPVAWLAVRYLIPHELFRIVYRPAYRCRFHLPPIFDDALLTCWTCTGTSEIELFFLFSRAQGDVNW